MECKQYVDQWIKWKMHTFQKRKRVIKYIRSKKPYERYQVDLVELAKELNMKDRFKYLLTWVDHFSKYAWAIPIWNKEAAPVRNALAQVFISGYPKYLQSDNGKEFTNQTFESYLENIEVEHILGSPYHPQSQGAIEAFNKTIQRALSAAYDNIIQEKVTWDLELNLWQFMHFYNCCRKQTTTEEIPKHVMDNFNDKSLMEKVAIATEKSRKRHLERNEYKESDVVLLTNWISKINIKKPYFKREKPKKGTKHQRAERHDIKGIVTKVKHQLCYVKIIDIVNEREDIEVGQEIRVPYDCVIKLN